MFAVIKMEFSGKTVYGPVLETTQLSAQAQNHASPECCRKSFTPIFLDDHDIPLIGSNFGNLTVVEHSIAFRVVSIYWYWAIHCFARELHFNYSKQAVGNGLSKQPSIKVLRRLWVPSEIGGRCPVSGCWPSCSVLFCYELKWTKNSSIFNWKVLLFKFTK